MTGLSSAPPVVAVVSCPDYDPKNVLSALGRAVDLLGGLQVLVTPGSHVLVKPNLLSGSPPDKAVCTHPAVTGALIRLLVFHGCTVTVADSPGGGTRYTERSLARVYRAAGYENLPEETGCTLNRDCRFRELAFPGGRVCTRFPLLMPFFSADCVVGAAKAKTHLLTLMTGATKNLFGLLPGLEKPLFHSRYPDPDLFSDMLLDLLLCVSPSFHVVDAIVAMEGDGPMSGNPRMLGALIVSRNALAADIVLCRLMSIDPHDVPYIARAAARGLISPDGEEIEVRGDPLSMFCRGGFRAPASYARGRAGFRVPLFFRVVHRLGRIYHLRPVVVPSRCTGCARCVRACPVHASAIVDGKACIDRKKCIRCYCCHEMCEAGAIALVRWPGGSLLHAVSGRTLEKG